MEWDDAVEWPRPVQLKEREVPVFVHIPCGLVLGTLSLGRQVMGLNLFSFVNRW